MTDQSHNKPKKAMEDRLRSADEPVEKAPPMEETDLDLLLPCADEEQDLPASYNRTESELSEDNCVAPPPAVRRNPFVVLWTGFAANLPARGDTGGALLRKSGFLLSLAVFLVSMSYLLVDLCIRPWQNQQLSQELVEIYQPDNQMLVADTNQYPTGMLVSFKELYSRNDEIRGWLTFHATGETDFLNIDYPIMYSGDNDKYLTVDFDQKKNKNGALFFDMSNCLDTKADRNKSLVVYGHNMASGQMLAGLNKLLGSLSNARAAASFTLSTLFRRSEYRVFAVILTDEAETNPEWYFNTRRTQFFDEQEFLQYVQEMRARSIYDYPVDVQAGDEIVVLSTCTGKSSAKVKDGRLVVVARRTRTSESGVITSKIQKNEDVIMPRNWYVNQGLALHPYYEGDYVGTVSTTTQNGSDVSVGDPFGSTTSVTASGHPTTSTGANDVSVGGAPGDGSDVSIAGDSGVSDDVSYIIDTSVGDNSVPDVRADDSTTN